MYESSAYMCRILFTKHAAVLNSMMKTNQKFNALEFFVDLLEKQFEEFREAFLVDWDKFYSSSPHGLLTILSNIITSLFSRDNTEFMKQLENDKETRDNYSELISRLMKVTGKIMMFATKISAENVSASVLENPNKEKLLNEKSYFKKQKICLKC